MDLSYIKENLAKVEREIWECCERAGRPRKDVRLIAVSKNFGIESIRKAKEYGQIDFGESRAQELRKKMRQFPVSLLRWHFIGPLQTNKVRYVLGGTEYVHSVDRWDLAEEMEKRLEKLGIFQKILIEVNTSGEETKHGFRPDQLRKILEKMGQYTHMEICGLMTMAPFTDDQERIRSSFRTLRETLQANSLFFQKEQHLSMGMSADFPVAIEEGATMVRVGSRIFGDRFSAESGD